MSTFWLSFIVTEAVGVASAFVTISSLPPGVKFSLENFIAAGQALILDLQIGK